jgi:alpha/beta superfamily hydrolase
MNASTQTFSIDGPAGLIECLRDEPTLGAGQMASLTAPRGTVVIAHPHPLYGGSMHNKVVQTLARAYNQCGWTAVRFNFRGVEASAGVYDEGRGELEDYLAVVQACAPAVPGDGDGELDRVGVLAIAGFSFGAFVASHAVQRLWAQRPVANIVLVGTATTRFDVLALPPEAHACTLVVHGELDDTVPLSSVMDWARPQVLPVTVVPGGSHFFHGQLGVLKSAVVRHVAGVHHLG